MHERIKDTPRECTRPRLSFRLSCSSTNTRSVVIYRLSTLPSNANTPPLQDACCEARRFTIRSLSDLSLYISRGLPTQRSPRYIAYFPCTGAAR